MVTPRWPYPPFRSPDWPGSDGSADPALASAGRALRELLAAHGGRPDHRPETLLAALNHAGELAERLQWAMLSLVGEAREHGVSWTRIGAALGVSKQAAHARFARPVADAHRRAEDAGG